jgi:meso-butanediol dehydrogenase/(S,S)-butanediol dehydrogenase/diacetyl reductase
VDEDKTTFGFTRQAAFEYAEQNIRINAISPGSISTQLGQNSDTLEPDYAHDPGVVSAPQETATDTPVVAEKRPRLKQAGKPEDIAYAALFLASEEAAFISGQNLVVDGGLTTHVG